MGLAEEALGHYTHTLCNYKTFAFRSQQLFLLQMHYTDYFLHPQHAFSHWFLFNHISFLDEHTKPCEWSLRHWHKASGRLPNSIYDRVNILSWSVTILQYFVVGSSWRRACVSSLWLFQGGEDLVMVTCVSPGVSVCCLQYLVHEEINRMQPYLTDLVMVSCVSPGVSVCRIQLYLTVYPLVWAAVFFYQKPNWWGIFTGLA